MRRVRALKHQSEHKKKISGGRVGAAHDALFKAPPGGSFSVYDTGVANASSPINARRVKLAGRTKTGKPINADRHPSAAQAVTNLGKKQRERDMAQKHAGQHRGSRVGRGG